MRGPLREGGTKSRLAGQAQHLRDIRCVPRQVVVRYRESHGTSWAGTTTPRLCRDDAPYKLQVQQQFDQRINYDQSDELHPPQAARLVELAKLGKGERVLDVATGTGLVALAAAEQVGPHGSVAAVDLSRGMLSQLMSKAERQGLCNVFPFCADIERVTFPHRTFYAIFCSSALPFLSDPAAALAHWYHWLRPGGRLVFNCYQEYFSPDYRLFCESAAREFGLVVPDPNAPLGTPRKRRCSLQAAGFSEYQILEERGSYTVPKPPREYAEGIWRQSSASPFFSLEACGLEPQHVAAWKERFVGAVAESAAQRMAPGGGVRNEYLVYNVVARKPLVEPEPEAEEDDDDG